MECKWSIRIKSAVPGHDSTTKRGSMFSKQKVFEQRLLTCGIKNYGQAMPLHCVLSCLMKCAVRCVGFIFSLSQFGTVDNISRYPDRSLSCS